MTTYVTQADDNVGQRGWPPLDATRVGLGRDEEPWGDWSFTMVPEHIENFAVRAEAIKPFTVAVIPAFNEERFVSSVVIAAKRCARQVIVVDDGSTDHTALFAASSGADVIRIHKNCGKGLALNAGFRRARELGADVVVTLDADAQHDAAEIPALAEPILRGHADIVIGSRFMTAECSVPAWRRVGQHVLTKLTNMASGTSISDSQSGYRAFSPRAIQTLRFDQPGLAMESEMQFLAERNGLRMLEVPVTVSYLDGNKRNPVLHGLQVMEAILSLVSRRRPLAFLTLPGVALCVLGLVTGLHVVDVLQTHHMVQFGTAILSALFIIVGIVLGVTGVILNSIDYLLCRMTAEINVALELRSDREGNSAPLDTRRHESWLGVFPGGSQT